MKLRDFLVSLGIMVPVVLLLLPLRAWWFDAILVGRSFPVWQWLDLATLGVWAFELVWSILIGWLVILLIRSKQRVVWALMCGALGGLAHFLISRTSFAPVTTWPTYVWAYGTYFVPMLGAGLAAASATRLLPR